MNSIQLWGIRTFLVKKSYTKIQYPFRVILILYAQFLTINVLILQNVLMPPAPPHPPPLQLYTTNTILSKMFQYLYIVYYQRTLQENVSIPPYCILPTHTFTTLQ